MYQNKPICAALTPEVRVFGGVWRGGGTEGEMLRAWATGLCSHHVRRWSVGRQIKSFARIHKALKKGGWQNEKKNITPDQVPWEKFYLSICGSFQTGGTLFPL